MAQVRVLNVQVLNNPTFFTNPFQFEITFECAPPGLTDDLEWKIIYVGCAEDEKYDQILDQVMVGPVPVGQSKFVFQGEAPDPVKILEQDLLGVTVVLLTCSYKGKEFIRVGYYVNNEYEDPEMMMNPPERVVVQAIKRNILEDKPRITKFPIEWD